MYYDGSEPHSVCGISRPATGFEHRPHQPPQTVLGTPRRRAPGWVAVRRARHPRAVRLPAAIVRREEGCFVLDHDRPQHRRCVAHRPVRRSSSDPTRNADVGAAATRGCPRWPCSTRTTLREPQGTPYDLPSTASCMHEGGSRSDAEREHAPPLASPSADRLRLPPADGATSRSSSPSLMSSRRRRGEGDHRRRLRRGSRQRPRGARAGSVDEAPAPPPPVKRLDEVRAASDRRSRLREHAHQRGRAGTGVSQSPSASEPADAARAAAAASCPAHSLRRTVPAAAR